MARHRIRWAESRRSRGLTMGFIGTFDLALDLMTGLVISHLLVASSFAIVVLQHFLSGKERDAKNPRLVHLELQAG